MRLAHWRKHCFCTKGMVGFPPLVYWTFQLSVLHQRSSLSLSMLVTAPRWFRWLGFSLIALLAICTAGCNSTNTGDKAPLVQSKS
jgi:hypothetical protein